MRLRCYCLVLILYTSLTSYAQDRPIVLPLKVGDVLPANHVFSDLINADESSILLSELNDRLLLLDFWATWCAGCINAFPKLESLEKNLGGRVKVLLVNSIQTGDTPEKVNSFFARRNSKKVSSVRFPSIVGDSLLQYYFPHTTIPHYVLIDGTGKVRAITAGEHLTVPNIQQLLDNRSYIIPLKNDRSLPDSQLIQQAVMEAKPTALLCHSFFSGYVDGLPNRFGIVKDTIEGKEHIRIRGSNVSLFTLYRVAYPVMDRYTEARISYDSDSPELYNKSGDWSVWQHQNTYCYELITRGRTLEESKQLMREDLHRLIGLEIKIQKKEMNCLVLVYDSTKRKEKEGVRKSMRLLANELERTLKIPVLDETDFSDKIKLPAQANLVKLSEWETVLKPYGLRLERKRTWIDVLVLSDRLSKSTIIKKIRL